MSPGPCPDAADHSGRRMASDDPDIGYADHDFILPGDDMKVRRFVIRVVDHDFDAVDDRYRRHHFGVWPSGSVRPCPLSFIEVIGSSLPGYAERYAQ